MDSTTSTAVASLETKLQALTDLQSRLQALRQVPTALLRPPSTLGAFTSVSSSLRQQCQDLKDIAGVVTSEKVQEALKAARDSEKADKSGLTFNGRRENRKRRRLPSPESPQPYNPFQPKSPSLFPISDTHPSPLERDNLPAFIRKFNRSHSSKLHIWSSLRSRRQAKISSPVVVRFLVPEVLTAFITTTSTDNTEDRSLVVEGVTVFGPRENKPPHSQSEYMVYQKLSQQIAKMLQSHPRVSFQSLMGLLSSYEGLFVDRCTVCQRVLSTEEHVPPVARLWIDQLAPTSACSSSAEGDTERGNGAKDKGVDDGKRARWEPRHPTCLQG
ncbi:hypothetical protein JAAARDRAFT_178157 [Jaapia argillacea MUCL 33604]|uniref:Mediator complex subunit 27 n=1 Tax=Jaapia argillacea MUCL 33604 TaxID=933084 RepID=A0A067PSL8_9AGAM|nr:hypothetical protein JAAARDRAFT_178157 [Jaapia argillacea MUCL 33604]